MSKREVKIYMTSDKRLIVKDGSTEYFMNIYNGGGYYTDIYLQTQEEINKAKAEREKVERDQVNRLAEEKYKPLKKWWRR